MYQLPTESTAHITDATAAVTALREAIAGNRPNQAEALLLKALELEAPRDELLSAIMEQGVAAEKMLDEISAYIEQNFGLIDVARCAGHAPPRAIEVLEKWRRAQKKREDFFSKPKRRAGLQRSDPRIDLALFDVAPHFAAMLAHICPHNDSFLPSHLLSKSKARSQNHCCVQGARQPAASGRRRKPSARYVRTSTARCCCSSR